MEDWLDLNPDPAHVRREREKARELRKTDWWRALVAKGVCHYCHRNVGAENLTLDHVVPVARGGRSTRGNLVVCCRACNQAKKFLAGGDKVKVVLRFKGREMTHQDIGREVIARFMEAVSAEGTNDKAPSLDGRFMSVVLSPVKK